MKLVCPTCSKAFTIKGFQEGKTYSCPQDKTPLVPRASASPSLTDRVDVPVRLGRYRIQGEIARGGMGVVFRAVQEGVERPVAIKMMIDDSVTAERIGRMQREIKAVGKLRHPNIVAVHSAGEYQGLPWYSMDLVDGKPLDRYLELGVVTSQERLTIMRDAALAIDYAHENGIIHRDLKPSNLMIDTEGQVKLLDFGLAKDLSSHSLLSYDGEIMGTPSFMSPEQAEGEPTGPPTDIYALGAMLYCLITGQPPHQGPTAVLTVYSVIHNDVPDPRSLDPRISDDLAAICYKAMARKAEDRYESAAALADDLDRVLNGEPVSVRPPSGWDRFKSRFERHRTAVMAVAGVALLGLLGIVWATLSAPDKIDAMIAGLEDPGTRPAAIGSMLDGLAEGRFSDEDRGRFMAPLVEHLDASKASEAERKVLLDFLERHALKDDVRKVLLPKVGPGLAAYMETAPKAEQLRLIEIGHATSSRFCEQPAVKLLTPHGDLELRKATCRYFVKVPSVKAFKALNRLVWDPECGDLAMKAVKRIYDSGALTLFTSGHGVGNAMANAQAATQTRLREMTAMMDGRDRSAERGTHPWQVAVRSLRAPDPDLRLKACWELGQLKEQRAAEPLLDALKDPETAGAAAHALSQLSVRKYQARIVALLGHAQPATRAAAAHLLGRIKAPDTLAALTAARKKEQDPQAQAALMRAELAIREGAGG